MNTKINRYSYEAAANFFFGMSVVALIMAEYGLTSLVGSWNPTHGTAIGLGVLSIALSSLGRLNQNK